MIIIYRSQECPRHVYNSTRYKHSFLSILTFRCFYSRCDLHHFQLYIPIPLPEYTFMFTPRPVRFIPCALIICRHLRHWYFPFKVIIHNNLLTVEVYLIVKHLARFEGIHVFEVYGRLGVYLFISNGLQVGFPLYRQLHLG